MLLNRFLRLHNFTEHPFNKVAGEKEELLQLYFVEPRYFSEALGDARNPKSYVIFGPRGGGKSAIRSMIDLYCDDAKYEADIGGKVLCITYDDFSSINLHQLNTITLTDHINEILKRGVPKLAVSLVEREIVGDSLQEQTRGLLRWYIDEYMSDLSRLELDSIVRMLKVDSKKIQSLISDIINLYNTIISVLKLEQIKPVQPVDSPKAKRDSISSIHVMEVFARLAAEVGFDAVYVFLDKVDETDFTGGNSQKAAKLVAPMLTNIKLLELNRYAFKFFLWENVRTHFGAELRADRIAMKTTEWSIPDLEMMLERRVQAYSLKRTTLVDLFEPEIQHRIKGLLINLAYKSPRDLNRLLEAIFAEAAPEATEENYKISWKAVISGFNRFSVERANELYGSEIVKRLLRLRKTTFTIAEVAATFKITYSKVIPDHTATNQARNIVEKWKASGVIQQVEPVIQEDKNGRRRSVNRYSIIDPRVCYLANQESYLAKFD